MKYPKRVNYGSDASFYRYLGEYHLQNGQKIKAFEAFAKAEVSGNPNIWEALLNSLDRWHGDEKLLYDKLRSWQKTPYACRDFFQRYPKYWQMIIAAKNDYRPNQVGPNKQTSSQSRHISSRVREHVFFRDQGKCSVCGSAQDLHFDHIIPVSKGGSNTVENIRILCTGCNLKRGNNIGDP